MSIAPKKTLAKGRTNGRYAAVWSKVDQRQCLANRDRQQPLGGKPTEGAFSEISIASAWYGGI